MRWKPSRKKLFLLIGAAIVIIIVAIAMASRKGEKPIAVTTDKAFRKTITQLVTATGKIQPEVKDRNFSFGPNAAKPPSASFGQTLSSLGSFSAFQEVLKGG